MLTVITDPTVWLTVSLRREKTTPLALASVSRERRVGECRSAVTVLGPHSVSEACREGGLCFITYQLEIRRHRPTPSDASGMRERTRSDAASGDARAWPSSTIVHISF